MRLNPRSLVGLLVCTLLQVACISYLFADPSDREKLRALNEEVREKLRQEINLDVIETPFADVIKDLNKSLDLWIILDPEGFEEAGVTPDQLVTLNLQHKRGDVILRVLLEPLHLRTGIRDGLLVITSQEKYEEDFLSVRFFNVRDLLDDPVTPSKPLPVWQRRHQSMAPAASGTANAGGVAGAAGGGKGGGFSGGGFGAGGRAATQAETPPPEYEPQSPADHLVSAFCDTVAPKTWTHRGGHGNARVIAGVLMVRQTDEALEEIADLLKQMRAVLAEAGAGE
jgi:hypothetical protein